MNKCSTGCPTQDHATYGECMRSKGTKVAYCNSATGMDYTAQKKWDKELDAYKEAKRQGIQPSGTRMPQIQAATEISDRTGEAYKA